jgi:aminoglycoside phosphotransferase (APT) family kinase protein
LVLRVFTGLVAPHEAGKTGPCAARAADTAELSGKIGDVGWSSAVSTKGAGVMRDASHLDEPAVARWLEANVAGFHGPLRAEKFAQGQSNPTFLLHSNTGARFVLRRKPPGVLLKSAHAVDREFRVQRALADSGVPVAKMLALCEDDSVTGSVFYVMEYVAGRVFVAPDLEAVPHKERPAIFSEVNRVLAAIHSVDLNWTDLSEYGPKGNYYARQMSRWTQQYRASQTETLPEMDTLIDWLEQAIPDDDGRRTLVHGDYRLDNLLFAPDAARIVAVLDWELSTIGHPFADLAALIMQWRMPTGQAGRGMAGLDRAALNLPSDADFIAGYCAHMGFERIAHFNFYLAFCFFRMAAILQGVKKRALSGNASNPAHGLAMGALVPDFAAQGLQAAADG